MEKPTDSLRNYQLLLVEQASLSVEEELRDSPLLGGHLRCRREEWTEALAIPSDENSVDLIIPVVSREAERAIQLFGWLDDHRFQTPTLAILPDETSREVLAAASEVVDDFILWPFRKSELDQRIVRIFGSREENLEAVRRRLNMEMGLMSLVGTDPGFLRMIEGIPRVAGADGTVLITGETGTGKELCARAIHHLSRRRNFPFVPVDCAAFPEQLLENELFGHARGAFTDARSDQKGLAAMAEGGTLFLDEVDALSLPSQAKVLRFLEDRVYRPLGSERFARSDVRVVAATNQDLETCTKERRFREDLFFRLDVLRLRMTSLRDRPGDIAVLARHFLEKFATGTERGRKTLSTAALRRLTFYEWPGNVRELQNVIQRAVAFAEGGYILPAHISLRRPASQEPPDTLRFRDARARAIQEFEKTYIEEILGKHQGNITRAAREAGKDRRVFGRLVKKHQIGRPPA